MTEVLFNQVLDVQVKYKECEDRRVNIRVTLELQSTTNTVLKKTLVVRLTDDVDPFFLYNLNLSEEDFQNLKLQQGLLVDFSAFPQRFTDLLQHCIQEQNKDLPRFLLQLVSSSTVLDHASAFINVVETNSFKHLTHLSLKLLPGTDLEIKKYLAACLKSLKNEHVLLEEKLRKKEDDLSRQLSYAQQALSEKSRELDRLRNEWTVQTTAFTNKYSDELTAEREKSLQTQTQYQQQLEQQRRELENLHQESTQQLQSRLNETELINKELSEKKYKAESNLRELKTKISGVEDECQRAKQEVLSLRRENSILDAECHEKEKYVHQLQTRVAVLEQEVKDKDQLLIRTTEILEATRDQKRTAEESAEKRQSHLGNLEATVRSLSEDLIKANEIISKFQGNAKTLMEKRKLKNTVIVKQEKLLAEKEETLKKEQQELQGLTQSLKLKEEEVLKLKEQLEAALQKLDESKQLLKTNENVITWLNKQLNDSQLTRMQEIKPVETPPLYSNSDLFKVGVVTHNMPDARSLFPLSGLSYPVPSKNSFPLPFSTNSANTPALGITPQGSGPKVHFGTHISRPTTSPDDVKFGLSAATNCVSNKENREPVGLDPKYIKKQDSTVLRGLVQHHINKEHQKSSALAAGQPSKKYNQASAYFKGQQPVYS